MMRYILGRTLIGYWLIVVFICLVLMSLVAPLLWVLRATGKSAAADQMANKWTTKWAKLLLTFGRCKLEVKGLANVPAEGAFVVMTNHQSLFDIPVMMSSLGRMVGHVAKKELFNIPFFSFWMKQLHCLPIDRKDTISGVRALRKHAVKMKEGGWAIVIFPEGTRNRTPEQGPMPFKEGSLRLALDQSIPILPVTISGTPQLVLERPFPWEADKVVSVQIAPPIVVEAKNAQQRKEAMKGIHDIVCEQWRQLQQAT